VAFAGASPTRNGLYDLDVLAGTGVLDKVPDIDDALVAGEGMPYHRVLCARTAGEAD
jgi:hypothetical protein